jgi:molecular chaperone GrpE
MGKDKEAKLKTAAEGNKEMTENTEAVAEEVETQAEEAATEGEIETPEETIARLEAELAETRAKLDELTDQMQRMAADFQNTRRRQERQLQMSIERATEALIDKLLPVLDDFEMAFQNIPEESREDNAAWIAGFQQIYRKLFTILEEEGLKAIASEGEFNPNLHEAISHEPNEEVESGHIIETLRKGYEHKERVLRPALVRVAQ